MTTGQLLEGYWRGSYGVKFSPSRVQWAPATAELQLPEVLQWTVRDVQTLCCHARDQTPG